MGEAELREKICEIGRLMHQMGYIDATSGNISARLSDNLILMTPGGVPKWQLQPDDLLIVDLNGHIQGAGKPTSEMPMHLVCYQRRDDIGGVVHAHPPPCSCLDDCERSASAIYHSRSNHYAWINSNAPLCNTFQRRKPRNCAILYHTS